MDSEAEDRLDRLARHRALGGPELGFLQAQLAHQCGDVSSARSLVNAGLQKLPGQQSILDFATEIGAPLPPRAQQIIEERSRWTLRARARHRAGDKSVSEKSLALKSSGSPVAAANAKRSSRRG